MPRLCDRLCVEGRLNVVLALERLGMELFVEPADGMFVWARFPHLDYSLALAEASQREGIMLAPCTVFRPHLERSPWMRFNVTACEDARTSMAAAAGVGYDGVAQLRLTPDSPKYVGDWPFASSRLRTTIRSCSDQSGHQTAGKNGQLCRE
jgi:hypothetical protein